jgi:hypothetical protein
MQQRREPGQTEMAAGGKTLNSGNGALGTVKGYIVETFKR